MSAPLPACCCTKWVPRSSPSAMRVAGSTSRTGSTSPLFSSTPQRTAVIEGYSGRGKEISNEELMELECDILVPAALGGVITRRENANNIKARMVVEAAQLPRDHGRLMKFSATATSSSFPTSSPTSWRHRILLRMGAERSGLHLDGRRFQQQAPSHVDGRLRQRFRHDEGEGRQNAHSCPL